ncbi:ornithine cyclodeaminase family protein [Candidatus Neomarinimicrobiota bacterium]
MLYLNADQVRTCLPMTAAINTARKAFIALSDGSALVPPRIHITIGNSDSALFMPAYLPDQAQFAVKVVAMNAGNKERGLPLINALVLVHDTTTGAPLAIMDGRGLTAIRTGAASGLATDLLARQNAQTAAIFGAGAQSRTQLEAVCAVRPIEAAYIFDPDDDLATQFIDEMTLLLGIDIRAGTTTDLARADVICTATTAETPVFDAAHVSPGAHINGVGSYKPHMQELPGQLLVNARLFTDSTSVSITETGDLKIPLEQGLITIDDIAEIGELAAGQVQGRTTANELTIFKSVGNAVQDLSAAGLVIEKARELGVGLELED